MTLTKGKNKRIMMKLEKKILYHKLWLNDEIKNQKI
jgi:hypothetical protein